MELHRSKFHFIIVFVIAGLKTEKHEILPYFSTALISNGKLLEDHYKIPSSFDLALLHEFCVHLCVWKHLSWLSDTFTVSHYGRAWREGIVTTKIEKFLYFLLGDGILGDGGR